MNQVTQNPYAPPPTESSLSRPAASMRTLAEHGPITFSGSVDQPALVEYLHKDGHVGWGRQLAIALGLALFVPAMAVMAAVFLALAAAVVGLVLVMLIVSTFSYRRLVFVNINPHWAQSIQGELTQEGVYLRRKFATSFYRWDWFHEAIGGDQVVALIPATKSGQPVLITRSMVHGADDWGRLIEVAGAVGFDAESGIPLDQTRRQNLRMLRESSRPRSVPVPPDAIAFEGVLTVDDFSLIPTQHRQRKRPIRTYIVISSLFFLGVLLIAGVSEAVFRHMLLLPALAFAYIVAGALMGRMRRRKSDAQAVYYLKGMADDRGIFSDFGITTTEIPWLALRPTVRTNDVIVLQRRDWQQFIVARRNMFDGDHQWDQFNALIDKHAS